MFKTSQQLFQFVINKQNCNHDIFKQYITQYYGGNEASNETCSKQVNFGRIFVCLIMIRHDRFTGPCT